MVKNIKGGSKQKSIARKSVQTEHSNRDPTPNSEFEFIAKVDKMLGNGMCRVIGVNDQVVYLCHIRGKFRGKRKSHNMILPNMFLLVGKRSWQMDQKKECDLLSILQKTYGDVTSDLASTINNDVIFTNDDDVLEFDYDELNMDIDKDAIITKASGIPSSEDEVDFDDI